MDEERTIMLDLGSSPDPLIDPILSPPMVPPSHIKTKSPAAKRLYTLSTSPRKRTFELDVGNQMSPQRLRVTVEADNEATRNTSRRLFQSPSPSRRMSPQKSTVTTIVPLRGLTDDEAPATTPRRRGRPRKSGTPVTTRRKRQGTPAKSRGSGAHALFSPQKDILTSDINDDVTPRPSSQPRRVAKRKLTSPAKEDGAPDSQPRKRGRPRKQPLTSDDLATRSDLGGAADPASGISVPIAPTRDQASDEMEDDDIWMKTLSDKPTPVSQRWYQDREPELPTRDHSPEPQSEPTRPDSGYQQQYDWPEMGGGMDSHSEGESMASETAMAGEEFTEIDIGTLLSMQPNSSVRAPEPQELDQDASLIINRTLEELRQSLNKPTEHAAAPELAAAATEAHLDANEVADNIQQPADHSLPPPPPKSPQFWNQSPRRPKAPPLAKQAALKRLQLGDGPSPAARPPTFDGTEPQDASAYDDSFSAIPDAVLAAATPRRFRPPQIEVDTAADEDIQPSIERPSRVNQPNPQSETNRLLTPDETPSPILSPIPSPNPSDTDEHEQHTQANPPGLATDFEMRSSPPIGSPAAQQRPSDFMPYHARANSTETPADQLASQALPTAGRNALPVHLPLPEHQPRPSLSPVGRVSRALIAITSDPPSPPEGDSFLGSPFRGSVAKSSQSPAPVSAPAPHSQRATRSPSPPRASAVAEPSQRSWFAPFSHIRDSAARLVESLSPRRASFSGTDRMDDPFGPDPVESTGQGSVRKNLFSDISRRGLDRDATVSVASSTGANSVHDDDKMSWQGEGSPAEASQRSVSQSSDLYAPHRSPGAGQDLMVNQRRLFQGREPAMVAEITRPHPHVSEPAQDYEAEEEYEAEEDMEDMWIEIAKRATPYAAKNVSIIQELDPEPPRRSKIPSPWRQKNRSLVYSDETQQYSDEQAPSEHGALMNEDEEYSMLAQKQRERAPAFANSLAAKKSDLAGFFSPLATVPNPLEDPGLGLPKALDLRTQEKPNPVARRTRTIQEPPPHANSLFAHYSQPETQTQPPLVPQKKLEIRRERSVDLFSPERRSTGKAPAVPAPRSSSSDIPEEEIRTAHIRRKTNLSPHQRKSGGTAPTAAAPARSASPDSPEEDVEPAIIPQKIGFSPRQRSDESTLFAPTPAAPRSLFNNPNAEWLKPRSVAPPPQARPRVEAREEEASSFVSPPPKPLPNNRAASPGKSCMRSPLKPKTPGTVVKWTDSTLSPLAQAQARAERRSASLSPEKQVDGRSKRRGVVGVGGSGSGRAAVAVQEEDKENSEEPPEPELEPEVEEAEPPRRTSRPSASFDRPVPSTATAAVAKRLTTTTTTTPTPLSPENWSRQHWLRLDDLLQARKRGLSHFQRHLSRSRPSSFTSSSSSLPSADQNGKRPLLGKLVTSQGETMPLEGWHLDVVEAFRDEVGEGIVWDEAQVAKRVFALLVGEERRRLGRVPVDRRGDGGGE